MTNETLVSLNDLNRAIIKFRGIYSMFSSKHGLSYNEMLLLYTIREYGYCTQKQICDNYLLPRHSMNHVFTSLRNQGILQYCKEYSTGKEKAYILSQKGQKYAASFLASLDSVESNAVSLFGEDQLIQLTKLLIHYNESLMLALEEKGNNG